MFCSNCGIRMEDGQTVCQNCGFSTEVVRSAEPAPVLAGNPAEYEQAGPAFNAYQNTSQNYYAENTKFCGRCGARINSEAVVCVNCGCSVAPETKKNTGRDETMILLVKIFLIIGCISLGWMILPLLWCIPITASIIGKLNSGEPVSSGLKIAALFCVNPIAGVVLLCMED